jgi:hypothetical protein
MVRKGAGSIVPVLNHFAVKTSAYHVLNSESYLKQYGVEVQSHVLIVTLDRGQFLCAVYKFLQTISSF